MNKKHEMNVDQNGEIKKQTLLDLLNRMEARHQEFSGAYFWHPARWADGRRAHEFEVRYEFEFEGIFCYFYQSYSESCKNCYYSSNFSVNNQKKDVRILRKIIAKLQDDGYKAEEYWPRANSHKRKTRVAVQAKKDQEIFDEIWGNV